MTVVRYTWQVFKRIRDQLDFAALIAKVVRTSGIDLPRRPAQLARVVRAVSQTAFGPQLAVAMHAATHPEKMAVIEYGDRGVRRLTWGEFDAMVNRAGHALVARGVRGGSRVAVMLPNCLEYLIAQQALARLGAIAVQISYRSKPGEIAHILRNANPSLTIAHSSTVAAMRDAHARVGGSSQLLVVDASRDDSELQADDWGRALAAGSPELPPKVAGGHGGGLLVYTSGTTGTPKGADRAWRDTGIEPVCDMIYQVGMNADDRQLVVCPLYHSAAPAFVAMAFALGATLVLQNHFDPEQCLHIISTERVTCAVMVPTMLIRLTALDPELRAVHNTESLRWVMSAAAPLPAEVARRFMDAFGPILWNVYGATETGFVTLARPSDHLSRPGTIGRPLRGNDLRLLDDAGHSVAPGAVGELFVANSMLISGYHGDAQATHDAQRDGLYSVGDMGRADPDGYYYLEARKHDMVISGGVNIYPREIEDHLNAHPAILDVAVVGVPDPEWGESLRAFVVVRDGHALTEADVIAYCRAELADFKRPRRVTFLPELPRNPTGKILKRELQAL